MKINKYIYSALIGALSFGAVSCGDDNDFTETIFPEVDETLNPESPSYKLDKYLQINYLDAYNLDFRYKMQDVGADMNYNLVPATYQASVDLAVLTKYLWFDVYDDLAGEDFLRTYGPRIIHLIGSPAFNPVNGTMILGLAEGGLKVSLFRVNYIDPEDALQLNEYYLKTMYHEFAHILHQTKTYPPEFDLISSTWYSPFTWQERDDRVCNSFGCITNYASSEDREDFAETIANYITKTDEQWAEIMRNAALNWETNGEGQVIGEGVDDGQGGLADGVDGVAIINQKVQIARTWLRDAWNLDLDELRAEVQRRQTNIDIEALRLQVETIE